MLTAVEGVFRNGRVELRETPNDIEEARVVVTFLEPATRSPTAVQARPAPTAWEHLQKDEWPEEMESNLAGTRVPVATPATSDERLHAFHALLASLPEAPAVPLAAMDRENLYP